MKILFDLSSAQPHYILPINGGGEYSTTIFEQIFINNKDAIIDVLLNDNYGENLYINNFCEKNSIKINKYNTLEEFSSIANLYDNIILPVCYPYYSRLTLKKGIKIIAVVHDLSTYTVHKIKKQSKKYFSNDKLKYLKTIISNMIKSFRMYRSKILHQKLFELSENMIFIYSSFQTRTASSFYLDIDKNHKSYVLYPPLKPQVLFSTMEEIEILNNYGVKSKDYFLLLAVNRPLKNAESVIKALDDLYSSIKLNRFMKNKDTLLLGANNKIQKTLLSKKKNKNKFKTFDYVASKDLEVLYKNAHLLIFPSLHEGFGYPPIEAMKYNTFSACSTSTSITEICGNGVMYFDPYDVEHIKLSIIKSFDEEYINLISNNLIKQYKFILDKQKNDLTKFNSIVRIFFEL